MTERNSAPKASRKLLPNNRNISTRYVLFNNQRPYSVALVVPNQHALKTFLEEKDLTANSEEGIRAAINLIESEVNEYRTNGKYARMFPQRWLPVAIGILEESFTEENGLMNSTLKIVRGKIMEKYNDLIEYLYTPDAKAITNERNIEEVEKMKLG